MISNGCLYTEDRQIEQQVNFNSCIYPSDLLSILINWNYMRDSFGIKNYLSDQMGKLGK